MSESRLRKDLYPDTYGTPQCPGSRIRYNVRAPKGPPPVNRPWLSGTRHVVGRSAKLEPQRPPQEYGNSGDGHGRRWLRLATLEVKRAVRDRRLKARELARENREGTDTAEGAA